MCASEIEHTNALVLFWFMMYPNKNGSCFVYEQLVFVSLLFDYCSAANNDQGTVSICQA